MKSLYLDRALSQKLLSLLHSFPCVVIVGARQVGKSTLLQHLFPEYNYVVFDPVIDIENARQDPELFLQNRACPVILDEIQYAPELLAPIKRQIDQTQKAGQYILTGSQQWGVLKNVAESLAGRAVFLDLEGLALSEIAQSSSHWLGRWLDSPETFVQEPMERLQLPHTLYEHLWRGSLPRAQFVAQEHVHDLHAAYQRTYIERDVRLLADISDLQLFGRFVRLVSALSAQEVQYTQLGRDLGVHGQTVKHWLRLLQETFQWFEYPAYSNNTVKRVSLKSKGYCSDTGQICYMQAITTPNSLGGHPLWGPIFETAVVNEIRKQASFLMASPMVYHWRSHGGAECDLILERDGRLYPIEIKATSRPTKADTKGLEAFRNTYPSLNIAKGLVIAPTERFFPLSETAYALPWDSA